MPTTSFAEELHATKYRASGESFRGACNRVANALKDGQEHYYAFREILLDGRFSPGGRIWAAMGAERRVSAYNCKVSCTIPDSALGIMQAATEAMLTMRAGCGIGYALDTLRPAGDLIASLQSRSSGPVSFMCIFDAVCGTVSSAGHRRGAQMGVMRIDHPDIFEFVRAKRPVPEAQPLWDMVESLPHDDPRRPALEAALQTTRRLTNFNISVAVTDEFMAALKADADFDLRFDGRRYATIRAADLWDEIMRSTWDYADPGVLFIDRINEWNNLHYCETISATNPCGEQPLPPYGACLLGSFNLTRYLGWHDGRWTFDERLLRDDIPHVVRAMDNVIDRTIYPLPQQEQEAKQKRRMGLGVMGVANALEALGLPYGSAVFVERLEGILGLIKTECYRASAQLAGEKGAFPLYDAEQYLQGRFIQSLPDDVQAFLRPCGIRNSHLTSIAPTGTISFSADNVSGGIEPVYEHEQERTVNMPGGPRVVRLQDYGYARFGIRGRTANECTADEHLSVLIAAQRHVDSAVSKTCNVGPGVSWEDFRQLYVKAYDGGAKGCTTFRNDGKVLGILRAANDGAACAIDPATGSRTCAE